MATTTNPGDQLVATLLKALRQLARDRGLDALNPSVLGKQLRRTASEMSAEDHAAMVDRMARREERLRLGALVASAERCHGVGSPEWVAARAAFDANCEEAV